LNEVVNGVEPPATEPVEDASIRAAPKKEVAEIKAKGGIVDVTPELP
jgi:hypothetical protein